MATMDEITRTVLHLAWWVPTRLAGGEWGWEVVVEEIYVWGIGELRDCKL